MGKVYVNEGLIIELKKGSYESCIESVFNKVNENYKKITGKDNGQLDLLATFKNNAIVVDEDSDFYRITFNSDGNNSQITNVEKFDVNRLDDKDIEMDVLNQFSNDFINSIDNATIECQNKIRNGFENIFRIKNGDVKGYKVFGK